MTEDTGRDVPRMNDPLKNAEGLDEEGDTGKSDGKPLNICFSFAKGKQCQREGCPYRHEWLCGEKDMKGKDKGHKGDGKNKTADFGKGKGTHKGCKGDGKDTGFKGGGKQAAVSLQAIAGTLEVLGTKSKEFEVLTQENARLCVDINSTKGHLQRIKEGAKKDIKERDDTIKDLKGRNANTLRTLKDYRSENTNLQRDISLLEEEKRRDKNNLSMLEQKVAGLQNELNSTRAQLAGAQAVTATHTGFPAQTGGLAQQPFILGGQMGVPGALQHMMGSMPALSAHQALPMFPPIQDSLPSRKRGYRKRSRSPTPSASRSRSGSPSGSKSPSPSPSPIPKRRAKLQKRRAPRGPGRAGERGRDTGPGFWMEAIIYIIIIYIIQCPPEGMRL